MSNASNNSLLEFRRQIDELDQKMAKIFAERMALVRKINRCKKKLNLPILDTSREAEIVANRVAETPEELVDFSADFFKSILRISKDYQRQLQDERAEK